MTSSQINYHKMREERRHNAEQEANWQAQIEQQRYATDTQAATSRYAAETSASASRYAAETNAAASRYGAQLSSEASRYGAELSSGASRYVGEQRAEATKYSADKSSEASKYKVDTESADRQKRLEYDEKTRDLQLKLEKKKLNVQKFEAIKDAAFKLAQINKMAADIQNDLKYAEREADRLEMEKERATAQNLLDEAKTLEIETRTPNANELKRQKQVQRVREILDILERAQDLWSPIE